MLISWSNEIPLLRKAINVAIPHDPGLYQILQDQRYKRYGGETRILYTGKAMSLARRDRELSFYPHDSKSAGSNCE